MRDARCAMRAFTPLSWRPVLLLPAASASQAAWRSPDGSGDGAGTTLKHAAENLFANLVPGEDGAGAGPAAAATPGVANKPPAAPPPGGARSGVPAEPPRDITATCSSSFYSIVRPLALTNM
jgi:hypothetical protein